MDLAEGTAKPTRRRARARLPRRFRLTLASSDEDGLPTYDLSDAGASLATEVPSASTSSTASVASSTSAATASVASATSAASTMNAVTLKAHQHRRAPPLPHSTGLPLPPESIRALAERKRCGPRACLLMPPSVLAHPLSRTHVAPPLPPGPPPARNAGYVLVPPPPVPPPPRPPMPPPYPLSANIGTAAGANLTDELRDSLVRAQM